MISLLSTLQEHEKDVVHALWAEYGNMMYKIAFSYLKNQSDAEDAVQDTFVRIIRHIDYFYGVNATNVKGLIYIYIRSTCINTFNKKKKERRRTTSLYSQEYNTFLDYEDANYIRPDILFENKSVSETTYNLISQLDDKYKDVLLLKYYHGYKEREIAEALDITLDNVGVRIYRAKAILAQKIKHSEYKDLLIEGSV